MLDRVRGIFFKWWIVLFIMLISFIAAFPAAMKYPGIDQGVFLYVGNRVLHGDVLYRDAWEHKGPVFYTIQIIEILIGNGSFWGIVLVQFLIIFGTFYLLFLVVKKYFDTKIGIISVGLLAVVLISWLRGGNVPSAYGLIFQGGLMYLLLVPPKNFKTQAVLAGLLSSLNFLIKPTYVGTAFVFFVVWLWLNRKSGNVWKFISLFVLGFLAGVLPFLLYFAINGSLRDFFNTFIIFNLVHANATLDSVNLPTGVIPLALLRIKLCFLHNVENKIILGFMLLWLFLMVNFLRKKVEPKMIPLAVTALATFAIELFFSSFSFYKPIYHYYITIVPSGVFLLAYFLDYFRKIFFNRYVIALVVVCAVLVSYPVFRKISGQNAINNQEDVSLKNEIAYIKANTKLSDYVMVWGSKTSLNFMSGRRSPSKYPYSTPIFFMPSTETTAMISRFTKDVERNRPVLIIDSTLNDNLAGLHVRPSKDLQEFYDFFNTHYRLVTTTLEYPVYKYE